MEIAALMHWVAAAMLAALATLAWMDTKSQSLIPRAALAWSALAVLFGVLLVVSSRAVMREGAVLTMRHLTLGVAFLVIGVQHALVSARRLSVWPSELVWLLLAVAALPFFASLRLTVVQEPFFHSFRDRLIGIIWMAIGLLKVARGRSTTLEGGTPGWILLLYVQAALVAAAG